MNFEDAYERYKNGTATDEEAAFVEVEIERARQVRALLDEQPEPEEPIVTEPDSETIKRAKKSFNLKSTVRTIVVVLCSLAILTAAFFGVVCLSAGKNAKLSRVEAIEIARDCVSEYSGADGERLIAGDVDRELRIGGRLTNSVYVYEVSVMDGRVEYEVVVSAQTGYAQIVYIDYDD